MMRRARTMLATVALVVALGSAAGAETVRRGVPVDSLTPAGMQRTRVRVPAVAGQPVRLTYAAADTGRAQLLVEVVVADDAAGARAALEHWRHQLSREIEPVDGIGDAAYGTGALIAFARDNVMIAVRRVGGGADVVALAMDAERAVAAAPRGTPRARAVTAKLPGAMVQGESYALSLSRAVLAADVRADGPARVRPTADGWRIARTGKGDVTVTVTAVDELLRVSRPVP